MGRCQAATSQGNEGTGRIVWILCLKGNLGAKPRAEVIEEILMAVEGRCA
jgi:hypothetical protein